MYLHQNKSTTPQKKSGILSHSALILERDPYGRSVETINTSDFHAYYIIYIINIADETTQAVKFPKADWFIPAKNFLVLEPISIDNELITRWVYSCKKVKAATGAAFTFLVIPLVLEPISYQCAKSIS